MSVVQRLGHFAVVRPTASTSRSSQTTEKFPVLGKSFTIASNASRLPTGNHWVRAGGLSTRRTTARICLIFVPTLRVRCFENVITRTRRGGSGRIRVELVLVIPMPLPTDTNHLGLPSDECVHGLDGFRATFDVPIGSFRTSEAGGNDGAYLAGHLFLPFEQVEDQTLRRLK